MNVKTKIICLDYGVEYEKMDKNYPFCGTENINTVLHDHYACLDAIRDRRARRKEFLKTLYPFLELAAFERWTGKESAYEV